MNSGMRDDLLNWRSNINGEAITLTATANNLVVLLEARDTFLVANAAPVSTYDGCCGVLSLQ